MRVIIKCTGWKHNLIYDNRLQTGETSPYPYTLLHAADAFADIGEDRVDGFA